MKRTARRLVMTVLTAAVLLVIALAYSGTEVMAANKQLEKGQIFQVGTCTIPGEGYGRNSGYQLDTVSDTFTYDGEYYYGSSTSTHAYQFDKRDEDEVQFYNKNVSISFPTREKRYYYGGGGGGVPYYVDSPGAYYNGGSYVFYLIAGSYYPSPVSIRCDAEDKGQPWGIQVLSGDGTKEAPFRFGALYAEPYGVEVYHPEHGTAEAVPNAEPGNTVKLNIKPDLGYEVDSVAWWYFEDTTSITTKIEPDADGNYSFVMPEADVKVDVKFKAKPGWAGITDKNGSLTMYSTMEEAVSNWKDGCTLTLYEQTTISDPIEIKANQTLDLNGFVLKTNGKAFVVNGGGSLTINDSAPDRDTTFGGMSYTGGYILGSVSGVIDDSITIPLYNQYKAEGVIDIDSGSVYMNGGSLRNQYSGSKIRFAFSASAGSTVIVNDGYIEAYDAVIMDSPKAASIHLAGGRYDLDDQYDPIAQAYEMSDHSAISVTGGYYSQNIGWIIDSMVSEGYTVQIKGDQKDWRYPNYRYRVEDGRQPYDVEIAQNIENGAVHVSNSYVKAGDVVTLTAEPADHYRLRNYDVKTTGGGAVQVSDGSFIMPASPIIVNAVFEGIPVTKVRLNKTRMTLGEDGSDTLRAAVSPANALNKEISWESSDTGIATVDANGNVKAVGVGKAKITATAVGSGASVACIVTVKHAHQLTKVEKIEATCITEGNIEYWKCDQGDHACGRLFADDKGENEIALSDTMIPVDGERHGQTGGFATETETLSEQTCTAPLSQNTISKCKDCGKVVSVSHHGEAPLKHSWGEWTLVKEPTEIEPGLEERVCSRDDSHVETRMIPVAGHEHVITKVEATAATCTEAGNREYWKCTGGDHPCGRCFDDESGDTEIDQDAAVIYPLGHRAGTAVKEKETEATCETAGSYESVINCSREGCGAELSRKIETEGSALGHEWGEWEKNDADTHKRVCSRVSSHVDTAPHRWDDGLVTAPTCKDQGKTTFMCMDCGETVDRDIVPVDPNAHIYGEPTYTWSDDNSKVSATHKCTYDGTVEAKVSDTTASETAPTCVEDGVIEYRAVFDREGFTTQRKEVPGKKATGHKWNAGKVTKKATVTKPGVKTFTCTVCGEKKVSSIAKAGTVIKGRTVTLKAKKLKKKAQTIARKKAVTLKKTKGTVTYAKVKVTYKKAKSVKMSKKQLKKYRKSLKKKFTAARKTGKIKAKKDLKKGTYKLKIKVKCSGNANYAPYTKTVTLTIKVK